MLSLAATGTVPRMVPLTACANAPLPKVRAMEPPIASASALRWRRLLRCDVRGDLPFMIRTPQLAETRCSGLGEATRFASSQRVRHANYRTAATRPDGRYRGRADPRGTVPSILTSLRKPPMKRPSPDIAGGYGFAVCGNA